MFLSYSPHIKIPERSCKLIVNNYPQDKKERCTIRVISNVIDFVNFLDVAWSEKRGITVDNLRFKIKVGEKRI
jgi:hypothetical protein